MVGRDALWRRRPSARWWLISWSLITGALLCLHATRVAAVVLEDADHFGVRRTWSAATLGVPTPLGGLMFSADGATLYLVGEADKPTSALYALSVTRDGGGPVTGFGAPTIAFTGAGGLDAGLEHGPGGTLFYSYFRGNELGERAGGVSGAETTHMLAPHGVPAAISGITFSPFRIDPGTGFGRLQIGTAFGNVIYELPLSVAGGAFTPGAATPFAVLSRDAVGGLQYVPGGTHAGALLYASYDAGELRLVRIDPATGLAIDAHSGVPTLGTSSPDESLFASELGVGPLGLEFDARTGDDLFVTTFGGSPSDSLLQIGGFSGTFSTTTTSTTTSTSLSTVPPTTTSATTDTTASTSTSATSTVQTTLPPTSSTIVATSTSTLPPTTTAPSSSTTTTSTSPDTTSSTTAGSSTTSTSVVEPTTSSTIDGSTSSTIDTSTSSTVDSSTSTTSVPSTTTSTSSSATTSLPASTTSSSTATSLPATTTSTERPIETPTTTLPPACDRAPTFASVRCRLTALTRTIADSRELVGRLEGPLVRRLTRAGRRAEHAEARALASQTGGARRLARRVSAELRAFAAALVSAKGRALPAHLRDDLRAVASEVRADVRALRAAL